MAAPMNVAIIGLGLVGKEVLRQLQSPGLASHFRIVSLSNSKYTLAVDAKAAALPSRDLIELLPPSSSSAEGKAGVSAADPAKLVEELAAKGGNTLVIDCTSDLAVTELYPTAIAAGLSVVTPNKKGFSSSSALWKEIVAAEAKPGAGHVFLEATVGAGLPILSTLRDMVKSGDSLIKVEGVFSGTMSYIFNNFSKAPSGKDEDKDAKPLKFSEVVKIAKANGYTEPNPADDLSGSDVARKLTILTRLTSLAPASKLPPLPELPDGFASLSTETLIPKELESASGDEFVKRLPEFDDYFDKVRQVAADAGQVLRYVGVIDRREGVVKCGLESYPYDHPFASSLSGSDNIVAFHTLRYTPQPLIIQGSGAGAAVTAAGVVGDAIKVAERCGLRLGL